MTRTAAALREDLSAEITARILDGRLPAAGRINEVHLAAELGVSRTPLREALIALAGRGLLDSVRGRGFLVPSLDPGQARQLYQLVAELEALALRWSPLQDLLALLDDLRRLNARMAEAVGAGTEPFTWDDRWHARLLSRCANAPLVGLIEQVKPQLKRYEAVFFVDEARARESVEEHDRIADAVEAGDMAAASRLLVGNWLKGGRVLTEGTGR